MFLPFQDSLATYHEATKWKKGKMLPVILQFSILLLDVIASLEWGYESESVRIIMANNEYLVKH